MGALALYFIYLIQITEMNITPENDRNLSALTVRLRNQNSPVGSGVIYFSEYLKDKIYILTAAHCLYEDLDGFDKPLKQITVDFFNSESNSYVEVLHQIDYSLVIPKKETDVAVLIFSRKDIPINFDAITKPQAIKERQSVTTFVTKGYPQATKGQELVCVYPTWLQDQPNVYRFQLNLSEDYTAWSTQGFSGSGIFLISNNKIYLYGIFTRFRAEGKGKVIYCQFVDSINKILIENYKTPIPFTFWAEHGLSQEFFERQITTAIKNLGPRFNESLNFRLPIAKRFNDIAKDSLFRKRVESIFDKWLLSKKNYYLKDGNPVYNAVNPSLSSLQATVTNWITNIDWVPEQIIDVNPIISKLNILTKTLDSKLDEVYKLQSEARRKETDKETQLYSYRQPYEDEIRYLRDVLAANNTLYSSLEEANIHLSNYPYLIISGDAGCGKSHLLGDIANERIKNSQSTVLLLGQLFKNDRNVWSNILDQLSLSCNKDDFLKSLNSIGKQQGTRVLVMIDALNEGAGKELWQPELSGFINEFMAYPYIGLVTTVRTTYLKAVVPDMVKSDEKITKITHEGFKGNEYAALKLFCNHYGLNQPLFPILAPEFTNPLFLQVICQGVKASGNKNFPQGFQGLSSIFHFYLKAISQKLISKRDEYELKPKIAEEALHILAQACFNQEDTRVLSLSEAVSLFENEFPSNKNLLSDLIHENVFTQNLQTDYRTQQERDVIYFAYERFGDFFIAEQLLSKYKSSNIKEAFSKGNELGELMSDSYWRNVGIVDVLSVLLPEKFNLEIFEVYEWVFDEPYEKNGGLDNRINWFLMDSLKWRAVKSIDDKKIIKWIQGDNFNLSYDEFLLKVVELSTIADHPFNSDTLFRFFKNKKLPERDSVLQQHLYYYSGNDDNDNGYPFLRLIEWSWQHGISATLDTETARLAGQTLTWILSSTVLSLRDKTTKALVNLLEEQPVALVKIITKFKTIDDIYILERLYAIAYGCILRTTKESSIKLIAQTVYNNIFKKGNPPAHLLLRDYARNIIEYAHYRKVKLNADIKLVRPPYKSMMPSRFPSDKSMAKYKMDHTKADYRQNNGEAFNQIHSSVMVGDFGRYTVDSAIGHFNPVSFTFEKKYRDFLRQIKNKQTKGALKLFVSAYEWVNASEDTKRSYEVTLGKEAFEKLLKRFSKWSLDAHKRIAADFNTTQLKFFKNQIIPHLDSIERTKDRQTNFFDNSFVKKWIVERTFKLGYDPIIHGRYDTNVTRFNDRSENKIERIGKKYQWIAFYEIMAILTDNYKLRERYSSKTEVHDYTGPWQFLVRDIDPVFVTKVPLIDQEEDEKDKQLINTWYFDYINNYWKEPTATWIKNRKDLPDPNKIIERSDEKNEEWLYLSLSHTWKAPKMIGKGAYDYPRKSVWYLLQASLVKKRDKAKIIKWLNSKNFRGRWLPETLSADSNLFSRENFWSPIAKERNEKRSQWENVEHTLYKIIVATVEGAGSISDDKSGAHFAYDMPCLEIFDGMKLRYHSVDGEFLNSKGDLVISAVNPAGLLIKKREFLKFLKQKNYDVIWTLLGEKQSYGGHLHKEENRISTICGVYAYERSQLIGKLRLIQD